MALQLPLLQVPPPLLSCPWQQQATSTHLHRLPELPAQLLHLRRPRLTLRRQPRILYAKLLIVHQVEALRGQQVGLLVPFLAGGQLAAEASMGAVQRRHTCRGSRLCRLEVPQGLCGDACLGAPRFCCSGRGVRDARDERVQGLTLGLHPGFRCRELRPGGLQDSLGGGCRA